MVDVFRAEVPGAYFTRLSGILLLWLTHADPIFSAQFRF